MGKKKQPSWFKVYVQDKSVFEMLKTNDPVCKAIIACLDYIEQYGQDEGKSVLSQMETEDKETKFAFCVLKKGADESLKEYYAKVEAGKDAANKKLEQANSTPKVT